MQSITGRAVCVRCRRWCRSLQRAPPRIPRSATCSAGGHAFWRRHRLFCVAGGRWKGHQVPQVTVFLIRLWLSSLHQCFSSFCQGPTFLLLFFGAAMCMEVPPPRATFLSRTSTWLWPSCWSWPCSGGLSGWLHIRWHCSLTPLPHPQAPTMSFLVSLSSQLLSAVLLLLRLWESGTREMDNERSTQGTSAPLLPLLQRFQNIRGSKEEPVPEDEPEVKTV